MINEFSRIQSNIQKSVAFLYTNNELSERETKKIIIHNCFKNNKIPRNKPNQGCKRPVLGKL